VLRTADGVEYDKRKIVLYAYRHSYAQRHADAGVPVEVLRELMSHRKLETTSGYYRVGQTRRREAVDRVAAMQFDRHGNRIWRHPGWALTGPLRNVQAHGGHVDHAEHEQGDRDHARPAAAAVIRWANSCGTAMTTAP
jgi:hypothetical protein